MDSISIQGVGDPLLREVCAGHSRHYSELGNGDKKREKGGDFSSEAHSKCAGT